MKNYDLKNIFLFSDLNNKEADSIKEFSSLKKFSKGEIIFFDTEPYTGIYGILEGVVKIYKISKEGREHLIHLEHPGSTFGEVPMFENFSGITEKERTYPANAMALEAGMVVVKIPVKPFTEFIKQNNDACLKMLSSFAKRLRFLNTHIENLTLGDVTKRLSIYLVTEYDKKISSNSPVTKSLELGISKYDLASHLGTINETLSRVFKKLQNESILEVRGKTIDIIDFPALKKYSS